MTFAFLSVSATGHAAEVRVAIFEPPGRDCLPLHVRRLGQQLFETEFFDRLLLWADWRHRLHVRILAGAFF